LLSVFFFHSSAVPPHLHSFPTRRSSDLTYYLASPIFVTALSGVVLGEHVGWRRWTAILIGFCGVLIALRPSTQTVSWPAMIALGDRKSTRLNSSHVAISYAVFCLKKKKQ